MWQKRKICTALAALASLRSCMASPAAEAQPEECRKTTVAILGAGVAGITTAQALHNASISDFLIVEYQDDIGGRMKHVDFGAKPDGSPYVVELGANWIQGLGSEGGPENPIWTFGKKWNVTNTFSNYSSILTYNETGQVDYAYLIDELEEIWGIFEQDAGYILTENLQDRSMRAAMSLAGWKPKKSDMMAQAVEWWEWDWETSFPPEQSSELFGIAGYNLTFYQYSDENNFVWDQRGFNTWLKGEASTFLKPNDTRLLLNTIVTNVSYSDHGVTVYNNDGSCISAAYAVSTFSLGVLQNEAVSFAPELPDWKRASIETFQMGTYTKIFLQFNETFWDPETQFFLYASPTARGYYPVWQSLSTDGFIPGSNILFVTVVGDDSYRVEQQTDEQTKEEVLAVLRQMFPDVDVPEPTAFMYPRWTQVPWAYGSYSNWPTGTTLEMHQNLRANVERLWFAGEAQSAEYFGFLHGAWFEGKHVGDRIAGLLGKGCTGDDGCGEMVNYEVLHGTTELYEYNITNGWDVSSFVTWGLDSEE